PWGGGVWRGQGRPSSPAGLGGGGLPFRDPARRRGRRGRGDAPGRRPREGRPRHRPAHEGGAHRHRWRAARAREGRRGPGGRRPRRPGWYGRPSGATRTATAEATTTADTDQGFSEEQGGGSKGKSGRNR